MFRVRRDKDYVARSELSYTVRAVELHLAVQNDDRLGLARVKVCGDRPIGESRHFTETPATAGIGRRDQLAPSRPRALAVLTVSLSEDSHAIKLAHFVDLPSMHPGVPSSRAGRVARPRPARAQS